MPPRTTATARVGVARSPSVKVTRLQPGDALEAFGEGLQGPHGAEGGHFLAGIHAVLGLEAEQGGQDFLEVRHQVRVAALPRQQRIVHGPAAGGQQFRLPGRQPAGHDGRVDLLGDEGHQGVQGAQQDVQEVQDGGLLVPAALLQGDLGQFDVGGAEVVPDQVVQGLGGLVEAELLDGLGGQGQLLAQPADHPVLGLAQFRRPPPGSRPG